MRSATRNAAPGDPAVVARDGAAPRETNPEPWPRRAARYHGYDEGYDMEGTMIIRKRRARQNLWNRSDFVRL